MSGERDIASLVLRVVVALLPADRHGWGRAMRAELNSIESAQARRSFAAGCAATIVRQPAVLNRIGYPVLVVIALGAGVNRAAAAAYWPLRVGMMALIAVLLGISWLGRRSGILGPVGPSRSARWARAIGYAVAVALTVWAETALLKDHDHQADSARLAPILTALLGAFLVGILALTSSRSAATGRVFAAAAIAGIVAAIVWAVVVIVAVPTIPIKPAGALSAVGAGMAAAAWACGAGRAGYVRALVGALCAGIVGALSIFLAVELLAHFGAASRIPDLAPAALSVADDLDQSRDEVVDPYVLVGFLAFVFAAALPVAAIGGRRRDRRPTSTMEPVVRTAP